MAVCLPTSSLSEVSGGGLSTADATLGIFSTLTSSLARARRTDLAEGMELFSWEERRRSNGGNKKEGSNGYGKGMRQGAWTAKSLQSCSGLWT